MVMAVGFLTEEWLFVLLSEVKLFWVWYEDMTELFVIEVVDPDLCQILGLEVEGPARPMS